MLEEATKSAESFLEDLAETLDVPPSRYEAAERAYESVGKWLCRQESTLAAASPTIYVQGSFRLGTAIKPITDSDDYDVDAVCELNFQKLQLTQSKLKMMLGNELTGYAERHGMQLPEPGKRCWTLNYAEEAQFHLDVLPSVPDGLGAARKIRAHLAQDNEWTRTAIAITDERHPNFKNICEDWLHSNPKGYAEWFKTRQKVVFDARRRAMALAAKKANVEEIPEHRVKTPLQAAIQIMKRHRDVMFSDRSDEKPISIIITTLAAKAYAQQGTITGALFSILASMDRHIEDRNGIDWVANPTDPLENFADKWVLHPERKNAFHEWLSKARADFHSASQVDDRNKIAETLAPVMGQGLTEAAVGKRQQTLTATAGRFVSAAVRLISQAAHRKAPQWPVLEQGRVQIQATVAESGFRPRQFASNCPPLRKGADLTFEAQTGVQPPFKIYWQVTNTGPEAIRANGLRGGFDEGVVVRGKLIRKEVTSYAGSHAIECFVVKDGFCVARSGPFIVNIR